MCGSGPSRTWRHNSLRDLLAKTIENVGFKIGYEHNGALPDDRRPGDIIVYNWNGDKHLLIDVSVTNSLPPIIVPRSLKTDSVGELQPLKG